MLLLVVLWGMCPAGRLGVLAGVFGDGRLRLMSVPDVAGVAGIGEQAPVVELGPCVVAISVGLSQKPAVCLSTVRWAPHDPTLLLCGASDGSALLFCLEPSLLLDPLGGASTATLVPARRFFDWRDPPRPSVSALGCAEWHPSAPGVFATGG
jgi:hypothetical protein